MRGGILQFVAFLVSCCNLDSTFKKARVIPAKAGMTRLSATKTLGPRLRGDDKT